MRRGPFNLVFGILVVFLGVYVLDALGYQSSIGTLGIIIGIAILANFWWRGRERP